MASASFETQPTGLNPPHISGALTGAVMPAVPSLIQGRSSIWNTPGTAEAYADFCDTPWYTDILDTVVSMLPALPPGSTVLDIGSGSGAGTLAFSQRNPAIRVIGVDSALSQVDYASKQCAGNPRIEFRHGELSTISQIVSSQVEGIVAFNSIHLLGQFRDVVNFCAPLIEGNGYFAFCTGYSTRRYEGEVGLKAQQCLQRILENAAHRFPGHIASTDPLDLIRASSQSGINSVRSNAIEKNLTAAGFAVERHEYRSCELPLKSIVDFLVLPGIGDSVLPESIPLADRRALITETLQAEGVTHLPRNWCYVVARKLISS